MNNHNIIPNKNNTDSDRDSDFAFTRIELGVITAAIAATATAWHFPFLPVPLTPADPLFGAAFLIVMARLFRHHSLIPYVVPLLLFLFIHFAVDIVNGTGLQGALEAAQKTEYLFAGVTVFAFLISRSCLRPIKWGIWIGFAVNVATAYIQIVTHGVGNHVTGLFNSPVTFSFYLTLVLCFSLPAWLDVCRKNRWCMLLPAIATIAVLGTVTQGPFLAIAALGVLFTGFIYSMKEGMIMSAAVLLLLAAVSIGGTANPWHTSLARTLNPFTNGRIKEHHTEKVAAARMTFDAPWTGVGSGRYQDHINTYYRELPNPPTPDASPTYEARQSGWGILFATTGIPCGLLLLFSSIAAVSVALRSFFQRTEEHSPFVLGSATALTALCAGMFFSDAFIRGIGWYVPLLFAFAFCAGESRQATDSGRWGVIRGGRRTATCLTIAYALLCGLVFLSGNGQNTALGRQSAHQAGSAGIDRSSATDDNGHDTRSSRRTTENASSFYVKVIDSSDVSRVTDPVRISPEKDTDGDFYPLLIPEKTLTAPEGFTPGMEYGGAIYDIETAEPRHCDLWMRVWWADSCGNSIAVRLNDNPAVVAGNDGTYRHWHWVKVPQKMSLDAGRHKLYLLAREDGVKIHQLLFTNEEQFVPQGVMEQ